jgi:putative oxidoreductase
MLTKINDLLAKIGGFLQWPLLLVVRLYWGWQFVITGRGKLMHLDKTAAYFTSLNIPAPKVNAILAGSTECIGGALLILGLFTRFASLALIGVMCVAFSTGDREALNKIFSDTDKFLSADTFLFLYAAVIIFAFGPGRIAVDSLIWKDKKA